MNNINIWGIRINPYTLNECIAIIEQNIISRKELIQQTGVNAHTVVSIQKDTFLRNAINKSKMINIDGMPVAWALKFLGYKNVHRASCPDIFKNLIERAVENHYRPFFLGATPSIIEIAVQNLKIKYPKLQIAGFHHGFFRDKDSDEIADIIKKSKADMLFLGMPSPKKELFSEKYIKYMQIPYTLGVGGVFDILANKTKRAPVWMQDIGLEWFYRLIQEPRRMWYRYLIGNTKFIWLVLKERFNIKRLLK